MNNTKSNDDTQRKTIKINPSFFQVSQDKNTNKLKNKTQKRRLKNGGLGKTNTRQNPILNANKIKKEFIKKIKEHHKNVNSNKKDEDGSQGENGNGNGNENETTEKATSSFQEDFKKSFEYLEALVKKRKEERNKQKTLRKKQRLEINKGIQNAPIQLVHNKVVNKEEGVGVGVGIGVDHLQDGETTVQDKDQLINKHISSNKISYTPILNITTEFDDVKNMVGVSPIQSFYTNSHSKDKIVERKVLEIKTPIQLKGQSDNHPSQHQEDKDTNVNDDDDDSIQIHTTPSQQYLQTPILPQQPQEQHQQHTLKINIDKKIEPPYGCLKGGKKPTYSQYNKTVKKPLISLINTDNLIKIANKETPIMRLNDDKEREKQPQEKPEKLEKQRPNKEVETALQEMNTIINLRKEKLQKLKESLQNKQGREKIGGDGSDTGCGSNGIDNNKPFSLRQRFKRYKLRTIKRKYKLGKQPDKQKISVLIKNNATRKKIHNDILLLHKTPLIEVKKYLKERGMLKVGSMSPEYVLREMYKNCMLSGDIHNISDDVLIHNYMNDD